jgi:V/A-type H+-transporting ATPase subunit B
MRRAPVEYRSVRTVRGPLIFVEGVRNVGWDQETRVRLDSGEVRHGVVQEVHRDLAIVQVYEGTEGIGRDNASVAFEGRPATIAVGEGWLGRMTNGRGDPIDGGPPILGAERRAVSGQPVNPRSRSTPTEAIITGVSAIDGLATLVRGQKLPIFSMGGLPHLDLAIQLAAQAHAGDEPFRVIFAALGITNADVMQVRDGLSERAEAGELCLIANTAADPIIERILTPRVALTIAEYLAFERDFHVLVLLCDMTNYCEALRELAASRGEVPARRGYPGYLYSDLASLYERCGRLKGRKGSVTLVPVLTMPAGDITHPVPDLTGYITEGQLVLSPDVAARDVYPPFDPLKSLSRLMRRGAGPGRSRDDHLAVAAQVQAALDRARNARELSELLGEEALSATDRLYLKFIRAFEREFLLQSREQSRSLDETLDLAWRVLSVLPSRELTMVSKAQLDAHYVERTSSDGRENQPQPKEGEEQSAAAPEEVSEPKQPAASKQRVGQEKATAAETTAAEKGKVKA